VACIAPHGNWKQAIRRYIESSNHHPKPSYDKSADEILAASAALSRYL